MSPVVDDFLFVGIRKKIRGYHKYFYVSILVKNKSVCSNYIDFFVEKCS